MLQDSINERTCKKRKKKVVYLYGSRQILFINWDENYAKCTKHFQDAQKYDNIACNTFM